MKTSSSISLAYLGGIGLIAFSPLKASAAAIIAGVSLCTAAASLLLALQKGRNRAALLLAAFCAGTFASASALISISGDSQMPLLPAKANATLLQLIDSRGLSGQSTALIKALIMGERAELSPTVVEAFRAAGASHILALSGLHVGIIYGILSALLSPLGGSRTAMWIQSGTGVALTAFYMVMTGASSSVVRAFIFICLHCLVRLMPDRRSSGADTIAAAAIIQLSINPLYIKQLGFQLSYLAVLGISLIYPRLRDWYPESKSFDLMRKTWNSAAMSISCQVFTAPLVLLHFGTFPPYFLISNLIALPLTELFIITTLADLGLSALGIDLEITKSLVEMLGQTLVYCLEVVAAI